MADNYSRLLTVADHLYVAGALDVLTITQLRGFLLSIRGRNRDVMREAFRQRPEFQIVWDETGLDKDDK